MIEQIMHPSCKVFLRYYFNIQNHPGADVITFELDEPCLGRKNIYGYEKYAGI